MPFYVRICKYSFHDLLAMDFGVGFIGVHSLFNVVGTTSEHFEEAWQMKTNRGQHYCSHHDQILCLGLCLLDHNITIIYTCF